MSNAYSPPPYSQPPYSPAPQAPASPSPGEAVFAPLPLRPRAVLENLDLAFKLFKQYWKPLLGWAAVANGLMLLALATSLSFLVGPPFMIGPIGCVLAAAVRGQNVGFRQCWGFSQPRIGNLLAMHLLSSIVCGLVVGAQCLGLFMLSNWISSALPSAAILPSFLYILVVAGSISVVLSLALAWQGMVSMVCCMEDEHRSVGALKRAWTLLRGRWKAALGLLTVLNLALLALWGVLYGVLALFLGVGSLGSAFTGRGGDWAIVGALGAMIISSWLVFTLFLPIYYLAQALFYLDARVRHEALDLEWNAHRTVEAAQPTAFQPAQYAPEGAPQSFFQTVEAPIAPPSTSSTWAPAPAPPVNTAPFAAPAEAPGAPLTAWASPETSASPTLQPPASFSGEPAVAASEPSPFAAPPEAAPSPSPLGTPTLATTPAHISLDKPEPDASQITPEDAEGGASTWGGSSPFAPR